MNEDTIAMINSIVDKKVTDKLAGLSTEINNLSYDLRIQEEEISEVKTTVSKKHDDLASDISKGSKNIRKIEMRLEENTRLLE